MAGNRPPTYYDPGNDVDQPDDPRHNSDLEDSYPYTNPKKFYGHGIAGFLDYIFGYSASQQTNAFNAFAQEDSQQHDKDMAYLTMDLQQQAHQENMLNDPSLMSQGLKKAGLSDAAIAQALTGNAPTGAIPTPHGGSAGMASGSMPNNLALGQAMLQLPLQLAQARLANSQASFTDTQNALFPRVTEQQISESVAKIRQRDRELGIVESETNSKIALNRVLVGKTYQEIEKLKSDMMLQYNQVAKWAHENRLDDAKAIEALQHAILLQKQGKLTDAQVGLTAAQTEEAYASAYNQQAQGYNAYASGQNQLAQAEYNWNAADVKRMEGDMFDMKLQISEQVGMPIESDEVGTIFMSMCTGNYPAMAASVFTTQSQFTNFGTVAASGKKATPPQVKVKRRDRSKSPYVHYQW